MTLSSGWKTYATAAVAALLAVGSFLGLLPESVKIDPAEMLVIAGGLFGLRSAIKS